MLLVVVTMMLLFGCICILSLLFFVFFFFSSRRRHTRCSRDWSSDVCSSDLAAVVCGEHSLIRAAVISRIENDRVLIGVHVTLARLRLARPPVRRDAPVAASDRKSVV